MIRCPLCQRAHSMRVKRIVIPAIQLKRNRNVRMWRGKKLVFRTYHTSPKQPVKHLSIPADTMAQIARLAA